MHKTNDTNSRQSGKAKAVILTLVVLVVAGLAVGGTLLATKHKHSTSSQLSNQTTSAQQTTKQPVATTGACVSGKVQHIGIGKYTVGTDLPYGTYIVADDGTVDTSDSPVFAYFTVYTDKATYGDDGYADHQTVEVDNKTDTQTVKLDSGNYLEVTIKAKLTCQ